MSVPRCEFRLMNEPCSAVATFRVARGRQYDAQKSCRRHLALTIDALMEGQDVPITVTWALSSQIIRGGAS